MSPAFGQTCTDNNLIDFKYDLPHVKKKLQAKEDVTIVALGSSSTAGAGASDITKTYPSQLEFQLRKHFPASVINMGRNGDRTKDMIARFDDVFDENPDLIIWQVGANDLLLGLAFIEGPRIIKGSMRILHHDVDLILIDPQYAPKILEKKNVHYMISLIHVFANYKGINLFPRFDIMQSWAQTMPELQYLNEDMLHQNDWSYSCIAKLLGVAIVKKLL
jgi:lysophospholipase L1-like esterase